MAIAQLMAVGYIDRVLTTNFDPLVVRACAMSGIYPAVYDFAASQLLKPAQVPEMAVFHLHGQRTGFVLMNTEEECTAHAVRLGPLFQDAGRGRIWVVVGYSGENDPVFDHLADVPSFDYGLFWVGYRDGEPAIHVRERLLNTNKGAYFVRGFDADSFFVDLAQRLECFPPAYVERPFSHLAGTLDVLTVYNMPEGDAEVDVTAKARDLIDQATRLFEARGKAIGTAEPSSADASESAAIALMMAGKYREVQAIGAASGEPSDRLREISAWSYIGDANQLINEATTKAGTEADRLFAAAGEKFQAALAIKPDMHEAFYNWGTALSRQARTKSGEDADRLFAAAGEKFQAALTIKPDKHEALNNWGNALSRQAETKSGEHADRLFAEAGEKFQAALAIKPDYRDALDSWGNVLLQTAAKKNGEERRQLLDLAVEKLSQGLEQGWKEVLYNLACAAALQGDPEVARRHLLAAKEHKMLPDRTHIESDPDFAAMRDEPWFREFLQSLNGKERRAGEAA